ncbi:MAG: amino acid permease [Firmicutes bacterium]|nr:amino acid permease [Bacillota bacterium]
MANQNRLTKKYGLLTAICMVIGTLIGSGIFFQSEAIMNRIGGNLWLGVLAWVVGGLITLSFAYVFATLASRYEKVGGFTDYSEALLGKTTGYFVGWFMASMWLPASVAILAQVAGRFTVDLFWPGAANANYTAAGYAFAGMYMVIIYALNVLSPKLAGRFQVSTTFIKVIPLLLMAVVGTIVGLANGTTSANLASTAVEVGSNPFFYAVVATAFAFAGWETAMSMNSEIKNSKRNLPIALIFGVSIVIVIYIAYFIGVFGGNDIESTTTQGSNQAFTAVFGNIGGTILIVFIIISCLGTLNGITMGNQRAIYSLSARNMGPNPGLFNQVDRKTNTPFNAAALSLALAGVWLVVWGGHRGGWWAMPLTNLLTPISVSMILIPIFTAVVLRERGMHWFNRFVAPLAAMAGAVFMITATIISQNIITVLWYLLIKATIIAIGALFFFLNRRKTSIEATANLPYPYSLVGVEISSMLPHPYSSTRPGHICLAEDSPHIEEYKSLDQAGQNELIARIHAQQGVAWSLSGHRENRRAVYLHNKDIIAQGRTIHIGIDINVPAGTPIYAPLAGEVVISEYEAGEGNYGGLCVLRSELGFYMVFAHLDTATLSAVGTQIARGDLVANVGDMDTNGNYFHHLHFQVLTQRGMDEGWLYRALCTPEQLSTIDQFVLDPMILVR